MYCSSFSQKNGKEVKPRVTKKEIKKCSQIHAIKSCIKYPRLIRSIFHSEEQNIIPDETKKRNKK